MQNLPSEWDRNVVYMVSPVNMTYDNGPTTKEAYYTVSIFGGNGDTQSKSLYRFDMLPQWMRDAIAMLDTAGKGVQVVGVGHKVGETYWLSDTPLTSLQRMSMYYDSSTKEQSK